MPKNTGFNKTLGRRDYVVKELRIYEKGKNTTVLTYLDFTSASHRPHRNRKDRLNVMSTDIIQA